MAVRVTHRAARSCLAHEAASGAVDNPISAKPHLRTVDFCPNKRGHLCDVRRRADQIFRHVIGPAAESAGFSATRADQISEPGLITTQVIQHIVEDPLVIADLTGSNPNVFYELAIRHAIRKPLVQIIQKDEKIPFDVAGMRTIPVDHRDLDSVQEAKIEIEKQIKSILKRKPEDIESPISVSVELQALRHSDNPEERSLAQFASAIGDLRTDIAAIEKRLSSPEGLLPPSYFQKLLEFTSRRTPRDYEYMSNEMMNLVTKLLHDTESGKKPAREYMIELGRLREIIMATRDRS